MVPPRVPQFNWVDLGLPSGTLWLDRLVGAQDPNAVGLFYQWGDIVGHAVAEGYDFSLENYEAKGLNLITSDLGEAHDAARVYYGPIAKMPSVTQAQELIANCRISYRDNNLYILTSRINGNSIIIRSGGRFVGTEIMDLDTLFAWTTHFVDNTYANTIYANPSAIFEVDRFIRYRGYNIMAVHS